ncbi:2'-5' RNA ligase superfamily protein [Rhizobium sp. NFR07]|uniref:2'-5' RNA ligase family protein n=1 Tax=Rhizobium sp. NFR07 TaxID=1566262 RepID=UPI0008F1FBEF|nr:2'-5' RNA ligase family protein [Rhizobium sp. NFR07]SFB62884.1 2'-5' RNA ligase superfamily protein [Rhizobium sp. NFR07]
MKTRFPLILTASIAERDRELFDDLRRQHFPPDRNLLKAHLTMFHRLPGEYREQIVAQITMSASAVRAFEASVVGIRHLGAGVAFDIDNDALAAVRAELKSAFKAWLGPQDMQPWRPHITVQNKVSRVIADRLYGDLTVDFRPRAIRVIGLDLWRYLGGPWQHDSFIPFANDSRVPDGAENGS